MYIDKSSQDFGETIGDSTENHSVRNVGSQRFHQIEPIRYCRLTWGHGCRDHRCSRECRARWAFKEATILRRHLENLPDHKHTYFGELVIVGEPSADDHKQFRKRFQKALSELGKKRNGSIKLLATSEIGKNLRMHYHYCMTADFEVKQFTIKYLWNEACTGWRTIVSHSSPRSAPARTNYMFKNMKMCVDEVRLLRKGSPRISWGHLDFYPQGKSVIWREYIEEIKVIKLEGLQENAESTECEFEQCEFKSEADGVSCTSIEWNANIERSGSSD